VCALACLHRLRGFVWRVVQVHLLFELLSSGGLPCLQFLNVNSATLRVILGSFLLDTQNRLLIGAVLSLCLLARLFNMVDIPLCLSVVWMAAWVAACVWCMHTCTRATVHASLSRLGLPACGV
jgi:hypothetical protein